MSHAGGVVTRIASTLAPFDILVSKLGIRLVVLTIAFNGAWLMSLFTYYSWSWVLDTQYQTALLWHTLNIHIPLRDLFDSLCERRAFIHLALSGNIWTMWIFAPSVQYGRHIIIVRYRASNERHVRPHDQPPLLLSAMIDRLRKCVLEMMWNRYLLYWVLEQVPLHILCTTFASTALYLLY